MLRFRFACLLCLSLSILFLLGCGSSKKGVPVSGKLVLPSGEKFEQNDSVEIIFKPEAGDLKAATAGASGADKGTDVSFIANTAETTGVVPGKYKIVVRITPYSGEKQANQRRVKLDETLNKKFDEKSTPLSYEVTDQPQTIIIDLGKATVTKG